MNEIVVGGLWDKYNPKSIESERKEKKCALDEKIALEEQYDYQKDGYRSSEGLIEYRALSEEEKIKLKERIDNSRKLRR